ncbi:hypothetical protein BYT27DRAFT_7296620 [Phlegmacium glaucopus]|nr:hypothetical protein BYT27DRAFT_7296620 [Phlegmacium glaucopus]
MLYLDLHTVPYDTDSRNVPVLVSVVLVISAGGIAAGLDFSGTSSCRCQFELRMVVQKWTPLYVPGAQCQYVKGAGVSVPVSTVPAMSAGDIDAGVKGDGVSVLVSTVPASAGNIHAGVTLRPALCNWHQQHFNSGWWSKNSGGVDTCGVLNPGISKVPVSQALCPRCRPSVPVMEMPWHRPLLVPVATQGGYKTPVMANGLAMAVTEWGSASGLLLPGDSSEFQGFQLETGFLLESLEWDWKEILRIHDFTVRHSTKFFQLEFLGIPRDSTGFQGIPIGKGGGP